MWTIRDRVSTLPHPPNLTLFLFPSYTLVHPLTPLWWPLPWDSRAGRTWSTRAKLSAKLRKIVSDTSSYPLWFYPSSKPRRYLRTGSNGTDRLAVAAPRELKEDDRWKEETLRSVQYPVLSSLIYGQRGDLAPCLRYNTYVTDMREIPRSRDIVRSVYASLRERRAIRVACVLARGGIKTTICPRYKYIRYVVFHSGHSLVSILMLRRGRRREGRSI